MTIQAIFDNQLLENLGLSDIFKNASQYEKNQLMALALIYSSSSSVAVDDCNKEQLKKMRDDIISHYKITIQTQTQ